MNIIPNQNMDKAIRDKHAKGVSVADIMIWFNVPESTVREALKAEVGSPARKPRA
jgi:hypothetical protein